LVGAAYALIAHDASEATLRRLGPAMRLLAEAELLEFRSRGQLADLDLAKRISIGKAGSLFAWVATATAIECREWASENEWQAWGLQLGLLYQLADDIGDFVGIAEGKDTGRDAATATPTLLQAYLRLDPSGQMVAREAAKLRETVRRAPALSKRLSGLIGFVLDRGEERVRALLQQCGAKI
jgi:geranylgeranyl pyrophosphate synthase